MPAFALNQVRIEGTVFVGVFQVQSAGFDRALYPAKFSSIGAKAPSVGI